MDGKYYNLWSTDNDKIDANDEVVIKSVYDPSPVGYSLPASNAFTGFSTTGGNVENWPNPFTSEQLAKLNIKGNFDRGYYFYTKLNRLGNIFFIPTSGLRNYNSGKIKFFLEGGFIWQAGPKSKKEARVFGFHNHSIWVLGDNIRSHSRTVRSAEERETHKFNIKLEMDVRYYNLWSTDNDKIVPNDEVVIKSVYDPSPVGYSLPASNAFTGFTTTGQASGNPNEFNIQGSFHKGWYFYCKPNKKGNTLFFQALGWRYDITGSLDYMTLDGLYWVAGPSGRKNGRYLHFSSGYVYPLDNTNRAFGFPVRSAEERETHKFNLKQEMDDRYYNLWSTDNDKIVPNDEVVIKSVYDPSPVGYSLPASNAFTGFTTTGQKVGDWSEGYILTPEEKEKLNVKGDFDKGYYFYTKPNKTGVPHFFAASGCRNQNYGAVDVVYERGFHWPAIPSRKDYNYLLGFHSGLIYPCSEAERSYGFAVRSAEEK